MLVNLQRDPDQVESWLAKRLIAGLGCKDAAEHKALGTELNDEIARSRNAQGAQSSSSA